MTLTAVGTSPGEPVNLEQLSLNSTVVITPGSDRFLRLKS